MNNHVKLAMRETESVAIVTFDRLHSGANIFAIDSLNERIQAGTSTKTG